VIGGSNKIVTMREAAEYLAVPYETFRRRWQAWGIKGSKIGKRVQFRLRDLDDYVDKHPA
jgi:excisionase family DNA binding protein